MTTSRGLAARVTERAKYDVPRMFRTLGLRSSITYAASATWHARDVVRRRSLARVDFSMGSLKQVRFHGQTITVPVAEVDHATKPFDPTPVFGGIREMFVQDCYLRGFTSLPTGGAVLDLGANRGMFDLIAISVLGADHVVAVEPNAHFVAVSRLLLQANSISPETVTRHTGYAAPSGTVFPDGPTVTMEDLVATVPSRQFSFCKMDIEGGEFALADEGRLFDACETIAAEVHPFAGSVSRVVEQFRAAGFEAALADRFGRPCPTESVEYLYASRVPGRVRT